MTLRPVDRAEVGTSTAAVFSRSWLDEAVSRAVGESRHVIAVPLADIVVPAGYLPVPADVPVLYTD